MDSECLILIETVLCLANICKRECIAGSLLKSLQDKTGEEKDKQNEKKQAKVHF